MKGAFERSAQGCLASWSWLCGNMGHYSRSTRQKMVYLLHSNQKGKEDKRAEEKTPGAQI